MLTIPQKTTHQAAHRSDSKTGQSHSFAKPTVPQQKGQIQGPPIKPDEESAAATKTETIELLARIEVVVNTKKGQSPAVTALKSEIRTATTMDGQVRQLPTESELNRLLDSIEVPPAPPLPSERDRDSSEDEDNNILP
jgi:hypothetical protein